MPGGGTTVSITAFAAVLRLWRQTLERSGRCSAVCFTSPERRNSGELLSRQFETGDPMNSNPSRRKFLTQARSALTPIRAGCSGAPRPEAHRPVADCAGACLSLARGDYRPPFYMPAAST